MRKAVEGALEILIIEHLLDLLHNTGCAAEIRTFPVFLEKGVQKSYMDIWYTDQSPNDHSPNDQSPNDQSSNDQSPNDQSPNATNSRKYSRFFNVHFTSLLY
jgi:hypothetical protein